MGAGVWWFAGGIIAVGAVVIWLIVWSDIRYPREEMPSMPTRPTPRPVGVTMSTPTARPPVPASRAESPARAGAIGEHLDHTAYPTAPSVPKAHRVLAAHVDCAARDCPRTRQALGVLAAAGKTTLRAEQQTRLVGAPTDVLPVVKQTRRAPGAAGQARR